MLIFFLDLLLLLSLPPHPPRPLPPSPGPPLPSPPPHPPFPSPLQLPLPLSPPFTHFFSQLHVNLSKVQIPSRHPTPLLPLPQICQNVL